jgi:uncharacterized protein
MLRPYLASIERSLKEKLPFIQVVVGPRQVGKTTGVLALADKWSNPFHYVTADSALPYKADWIETHWEVAHMKEENTLLIIDEVQKVPGWSEIVKKLWDNERRRKSSLQVILLGSSALLVQRGLTESLAGRFQLTYLPHWSLSECRTTFGLSLDEWLYFGGYPGSLILKRDEPQWKSYIANSLVETAIARDVMGLDAVTKPVLLRNLFGICTTHPAEIVSYSKMLGELHDAGNTTTLAHYLSLLSHAFLVTGLELYSQGRGRKRGSSPKIIVHNNALISALSSRFFPEAREDRAYWGRLVENAVGSRLLEELRQPHWEISYWRKGQHEVDFVVRQGKKIWGVEIKSGKTRRSSGLHAFKEAYPQAKLLLIGEDGVPLEEFLSGDVGRWFV